MVKKLNMFKCDLKKYICFLTFKVNHYKCGKTWLQFIFFNSDNKLGKYFDRIHLTMWHIIWQLTLTVSKQAFKVLLSIRYKFDCISKMKTYTAAGRGNCFWSWFVGLSIQFLGQATGTVLTCFLPLLPICTTVSWNRNHLSAVIHWTGNSYVSFFLWNEINESGSKKT